MQVIFRKYNKRSIFSAHWHFKPQCIGFLPNLLDRETICRYSEMRLHYFGSWSILLVIIYVSNYDSIQYHPSTVTYMLGQKNHPISWPNSQGASFLQ